MKLTVQVVVHADEGVEAVVREVFTLQRGLSVRLLPGSTNRGVLAGQVVPGRCGWCGLCGELVLEWVS